MVFQCLLAVLGLVYGVQEGVCPMPLAIVGLLKPTPLSVGANDLHYLYPNKAPRLGIQVHQPAQDQAITHQ